MKYNKCIDNEYNTIAGAKDKNDYSVALRAVAALHFLDYPIKWDVITRNWLGI